MGSLVVRASDSGWKAWVSMPDATKYLRVHTDYVLVKSVGSKTCGAESQVQGTGEYFLPLQFHAEIVVGGDRVVSPSIASSGNFPAELNRIVTCMVLKANDGRRTSSPLATMNFVGLDLITSERWH
ncbi:hypothetical protein TNCV_2844751 [Trichonephila clavipes]|nr:hypothetical protein TNCV_2844751 [Trichonephila clavipes]